MATSPSKQHHKRRAGRERAQLPTGNHPTASHMPRHLLLKATSAVPELQYVNSAPATKMGPIKSLQLIYSFATGEMMIDFSIWLHHFYHLK